MTALLAAPPTAASKAPPTQADEPAPQDDSAAGSTQVDDTPPAAAPEAAPEDDFDLNLDHAGLSHDPLQGFNRVSFRVSQAIDKAIIRPAAMAYRHAIPKPARDGVHNVLTNIDEPIVFLNDFLQLRPKRMLRTLGRFLLNSTLGLGGLFDVAKRKPFHLPHHNNDFGDTLGYYGVKPGPYIYLPVIGPTTLRDAIGSAEQLIPPKVVGTPFDRPDYIIATTVAGGLDQRERNDADLKAMLSTAIDPYATFRADFLQDRAGEIARLKARHGEPPVTHAFDQPLIDPGATAPAPAEKTAPAQKASPADETAPTKETAPAGQ